MKNNQETSLKRLPPDVWIWPMILADEYPDTLTGADWNALVDRIEALESMQIQPAHWNKLVERVETIK